MNVDERKYRFSEIMSAVSMLPDLTLNDEVAIDEAEELQDIVLPNLTKGLTEPKLKNAIICQAFRESDEFKVKLLALLTNSATQGLMKARDEDIDPNPEDLEALAISANILWAEGQAKGLFQVLGMLGTICGATDTEIPTLATYILRGNDGIEKYGKLDPIKILEGATTSKDIEGVINGE